MTSIPTFVSVGSTASGTGALTVNYPAGYQFGDFLLLVVETANQALPSTPVDSGFDWRTIASSPQGTGTAGGTTASRLSMYYYIASPFGGGSVSVPDSGDHQIAYILCFRGVHQFSPIHQSAGNVAASASTSVTFPSVTTTIPNCLIINAVSNATDTATAQGSSYTNASLSSLTERGDANTTQGNGGGVSVCSGGLASSGSSGSTTATLATSSVQGRITLALTPEPDLSTSTLPLIDNFENDPFYSSSNINWLDAAVFATWSKSTSHATQGTYSWRAQDSGRPFDAKVGVIGVNDAYNGGIDLSSYSGVSLDVYVADVSGDSGTVYLKVTDYSGNLSGQAELYLPDVGSYTLQLDFNEYPELATDNLVIQFGVEAQSDTTYGASIDVYFDNLRALSGGVTADASSIQASNTVSSSALIALKADSSISQTGNTLSSTAMLKVRSETAVTQDGDISSSTGILKIQAESNPSQANNTIASSSSILIQGAGALVQANNTISASGSGPLPITADLSVAQDGNTLSSLASILISGSAAVSQQNNTTLASATLKIQASGSATQEDNSLSSTGQLLILSNFAETQEGNTVTITGNLPIYGLVSLTQDANNTSSSANLFIQSEANITQSGHITLTNGKLLVQGNATLISGDNALTALARLLVESTLSSAQDDQTIISSGSLIIGGALSSQQDNNTLASEGFYNYGYANIYIDGSFTLKRASVWNGTTWVNTPALIWNGSAWL